MKKIFICIYIMIFIIFLKLAITFSINEIVISEYNKGNYEQNLIKSLMFFNIFEPYIAHYNYGNILHRTKDYDKAINQYEIALKKNVPQNRVCSIRINLSLSIVYSIEENLSNQEQIKLLQSARMILYEDECAHEYDDYGRSSKAEELEEKIKELEKEKETQKEEQEEPNDSENSTEEKEEKTKVDELEDRNNQANKERTEELENAEWYDNGDYFDYNKKRW